MKFVRVFSDTFLNSIKFSAYDGLHAFLNKLFSSLNAGLSEKWGKENISIDDERLCQFVDALQHKIKQLLLQYAPAQDPTHVLVFDSQTLKLNVRNDLDRLLAHLLLILDMGKHCITNDESLKFEIVDD